MDNELLQEIIEIKGSIGIISNKLETLNHSYAKLETRLLEIEKSYHKSMGAIWIATACVGGLTAITVAFANLWVEHKITDHLDRKDIRLDRIEKQLGSPNEKRSN